MRDRDGKKYCCSCKIETESEGEEESDDEEKEKAKLEEINRAQQIDEPNFEFSPNSAAMRHSPLQTYASPIKSANSVRDQTISTIYKKIQEYNMKLENTRDEDNVIKILQVIKECVSAIKSLETL